ncbi:Bug family tripartite tricarboxylate transporter substrate binding protein [Ottowia thiooxydans]|uniref:Bug family tripartite tricarboxylate transporter substrate binding protein n=1 Tax=Ottowia thiooxydans TaxID=219182 RepID=UPI0004148819|nr:tripartite tricarboxylate transporter substrate binding protein [Ottowia thiooxydans]
MLKRYFVPVILGLMVCIAHAAYPERPLKLVIGYPAGGSVDGAARILANHMGIALGQPVVVESRAGASGLVGAAAVAGAPADGYTLYLGAAGTFTVTPFVSKDAALGPLKSLAPIGGVVSVTNVLLVSKAVPAKSLRELIAHAKAHPGRVTYGSSGEGSSSHLSGELLGKLSGTSLVHVPYKGAAPAMADLLGGQISMFFDVTATAQGYAKHDRINAFGVTSRTRNVAFPLLPTIAEQGYPSYEVTTWMSLFQHVGTPSAASEKLSAVLRAIQKDPVFQQQMREKGYDEFALDRQQIAQRIKDESDVYSALLKKE